ncbi:SOS response-associated peptidase family protein [Lacinutrix neustonica]|uniref:Abasic site processing protein n=1 Tax=Lacinutrix neustonica TaxID=2980107 RepID=A0A9E8MYB2_9FLAO|nr:SOS response-associated peptidase family protein [Lacinutrix neustonica]WAC03256.1 SOS response-associated peptidase family protein [Lacinutrix neustonica]
MYYKLSNTAELDRVENELNLHFKHPKIYETEKIINGFKENTVSIITSENPHIIDYGIWGILPMPFNDDWEAFQQVSNTLNINRADLQTNKWYKDAFLNRRCLIIITGFFTSFIKDGSVYPYLVYSPLKSTITLGGIYNILEDGFITCSPILSRANSFIRSIHNINSKMPLIINEAQREEWLDTNKKQDLDYFAYCSQQTELKGHPIAKEFYKNDIIYNSIPEPVNYEDLPLFN